MKGFSLSYWGADDLEVAMHHAAIGWQLSWRIDEKFSNGIPIGIWQKYEVPANVESIVSEIAKVIGHRSSELEGFTLFWNSSRAGDRKPGWQMSVRRKGEQGWDISTIADEQAQAIFALLHTSGHPDGPITVRPAALDAAGHLKAALARSEAARDAMTGLLASWVA